MNEDAILLNDTERIQLSLNVADQIDLFLSVVGIIIISVYVCIALVAVAGKWFGFIYIS